MDCKCNACRHDRVDCIPEIEDIDLGYGPAHDRYNPKFLTGSDRPTLCQNWQEKFKPQESRGFTAVIQMWEVMPNDFERWQNDTKP